MGELLPFPSKLGAKTTDEQLEEIRTLTVTELMAAVLTKNEGRPILSADELMAAKGKKVTVSHVTEGYWTFSVAKVVTHD